MTTPPVCAQTISESERPLITDVQFVGNTVFPREQLELYVRTSTNRRILNIPGATWWRWIYQFGAETLDGGSVGRVFMSTGEPPAFLDSTTVAADVEQLQLFYLREGYRSANVSFSVTPPSELNRVRVTFTIEAGAATYLRNVSYVGLDSLTALEREQMLEESIFRSRLGPHSVSELRLEPDGERYSEPLLLEEGRRLLGFLRNRGFANATREGIHAVVYPIQPDSFDVTFAVDLGERFLFGDVIMTVEGPDPSASPRADSTFLPSTNPGVQGGMLRATFTDAPRLKFSLLERTLQFRPGDVFDQSRLIATKRRLDATGVFSFTDLLESVPDTTTNGAPRRVHFYTLRPRVRHQVRFETFMLQRSGALADSDNELGAGLGMTYSNLNIFGGGEAFRIRATGSIAADLGGFGGFTSAQWEVNTSLSWPYLTFPMGRFDRLSSLYDARSQFTVTFLAARRDALRLILRGRGGASYRFELRHTKTLTSFIDLLDITLSNPDTLNGFNDIFLSDILNAVDDQVQRAQIIEDYTRPQFNNALRYTIRSMTTDPFRRTPGHAREASFEVGGNLGYLLDQFVFTPSELEGSLPGLGLFGGGSDARLIYRQYLRMSTDIRSYRPVGRRSILALKANVGAAHPVGRADVIPFDRRFYSGGASSVRAWRLRELGPGAVTFESEGDSLSIEGTNILGGEIKLEGSAELRLTALQSFMEARWIVALFVDAGNVWTGPRNPGTDDGQFRLRTFAGEIGVGAGFGLRLAWDFLIVRLDSAYKVHDPRRQGQFLPDNFNEPVLQFGIGHAF